MGQDDALYATEDSFATVHRLWVTLVLLHLQLMAKEPSGTPSTLQQPQGYTSSHGDKDIQSSDSTATNPTPSPDATPTPVADESLTVENTPSPPTEESIGPRRSKRIRRPRHLISLNMQRKYHDSTCRPCPTSAHCQEVGHLGEGGM